MNIILGERGTQPYDARFELWFHPWKGAKERKLAEATRQVRAYFR